MPECQYMPVCPFFCVEVGYSPQLLQSMKQQYCFGDKTHCARLLAIDIVAIDDVPDDLLPSDIERLDGLYEEVYGSQVAQ